MKCSTLKLLLGRRLYVLVSRQGQYASYRARRQYIPEVEWVIVVRAHRGRY